MGVTTHLKPSRSTEKDTTYVPGIGRLSLNSYCRASTVTESS